MSVCRVEVVKGNAIQKILSIILQFQDKKQVRKKRSTTENFKKLYMYNFELIDSISELH